MKTSGKHDRGWGSAVTLALLILSMVALLATPLVQSIRARYEYSAREDAASNEVLPTLTAADFLAEVDRLWERSATIGASDYEAYFAFLSDARPLERVGAKLDYAGEGNRGEVRGRLLSLNNLRNKVANTFMQEFRLNPMFNLITDSAPFKEAQQSADATERAIQDRIEMPPEYQLGAVFSLWLSALLCCIPFGIGTVALQVRRRHGESYGSIALAFFSDWRLVAASLTGPASPVVLWMLFCDRDRLRVNLRYLTFALSSFLSVFVGGGAVAAKAQTPNGPGKKFSASLTERIETDDSGLSSTTMAGLTYEPTNSSLEGIVVKGNGFTRTYALYVQRIKTWSTPRIKASVSSVTGLMTFKARSGSTNVYAVTGARASIASGRFFWNTPHAAIETPLTRDTRTTSAIITRPGWKLTDRVAIVGEQFARFTAGSKPKLTSYALVNVKLGSRTTMEAGGYRTNSGLTGLRVQLGISF